MDYSSEQYHQYYKQYYNLNPQQAATSSSDQSTTTTQAPQYAYSGYYDYSNNSYQQYEPTSIHPPGVPIQPDPTPSIDPQLQIQQQQQQAMYYPPPPGLVVDTHSHYQFNAIQSTANTQIAQFSYSTDGGQIDGKPFQTGLHYGYHVPGPFHQHAAAHSVLPNSPFWPPPRLAWCELCRVDCNTREILEQHKKGKRHTKNLQIQEELKSINRIIEQQNLPDPKPEVFPPQQESLPSAAVTDGNKITTEQSKDFGQVAGGAKFVKTNKGSRKLAVGSLKQKEAIPFVCEMCNSKCESQVVFDSHLAGKKHRANLEKFHRDRAMFGEPGLKVSYPPNVNTSLSSSNQVPPATEIITQNLVRVVSDIQHESVSAEFQVNPGVIGTSLPEPKDVYLLPQQSLSANFRALPAQERGLKRKMRGGSMRMRTNKGSKPKEVIPFVCEMCNAKCETQLVFNSHLAGKKHKLNIAKFHSNEAVHGESGRNLNASLSSSSLAQNEKVELHDPPLPTHELTQTEELASASELAQAEE